MKSLKNILQYFLLCKIKTNILANPGENVNLGKLEKILHPRIYPKKEIWGANSFEQLFLTQIKKGFAFEISKVKLNSSGTQ